MSIFKLRLLLLLIILAPFSQLTAKGIVQSVSPENALLSVEAGSEFLLPLKYSATGDNATGLGVTLLFDASKLEFIGFNDVLKKGYLTSDARARKGNKGSTGGLNSQATIAWASVDGVWPGESELPVDLAVASFRLLKDASADTSVVIQGMPSANATFETVPVKISVSQVGGGALAWNFLVLLLMLVIICRFRSGLPSFFYLNLKV